MDCDCKDKYGGRLLNGSKSSFHEDELKMNSAPNTSTLQNTGKTFLFYLGNTIGYLNINKN